MTQAAETGSAAAWRREASEARKRAGDAEERAARADATIARLQDSLAEAIKAHHAVVAERDEARADLAAVADVETMSDGVAPQVGQRVVTVREVATRWGLAHAHDDHVHEITSLLGRDSHLVECGPRQIGVAMLRLLASLVPSETGRTRDLMADVEERLASEAALERGDVVAQAHALDEADRFGCGNGVEDDGAITLHPPIEGEASR